MLSSLNSKLRRRNSSGAALQLPSQHPANKIGPQRTTRTAQKLKLLPDPEHGEEGEDEESGREVYSQFTRIKDPTARRDAARLGKDDRAKLPRVTAYCTASSYRLDDLMRFLKGRTKTKNASPKLFDECIYSPYTYKKEGSGSRRRSSGNQEHPELVHSQPVRRYSDSAIEVEENAERRREDLIDLHPQIETEAGDTTLETGQPSRPTNAGDPDVMEAMAMEGRPMTADFDTTVHIPEVFLFEYGVVVIWGMTVKEEQRFLKEIARFEQEKLGKDDIQTEEFNFYYTREYQARIYNDFISLREKRNYMTKLAISHALAQSTKVCPASTWKIANVINNRILLDVLIRRPTGRHNHDHPINTQYNRTHRPHQPHPPRNQYADRRALHPSHQHPSPRLCAGRSRAHVGGAATGPRLPGCAELLGDGPESGSVAGESWRDCGSSSSVEGSVESYPWYVFPNLVLR
jgi:uncharacterized Rmd1/YagE family protein